jgi:hypothetical protein
MDKITGKIILVLSLLFLAACNAATSTPQAAPTNIPTPDLNPLRTEVAATVLAQVPQLCALTPTATLIPPATATQAPTQTPTVTNTPATGTPEANDKAMWVSQTVQDDTAFTPGQTFTMTWRIQNEGTSTWTTNYVLRHYSGELFGAPKEIKIDKEVKPGETLDITIDMKAPNAPGDYRTDWVLSNESLRNFKEPIFLKIKVVAPTVTVTPTKEPTATPTPTATPKS